MATILIAEAEGDIFDILRTRLENHGYTVLGASDGAQALQALRNEQNRVDLVITGVQMPKMNGLELGYQLRTEYPRLPVIYISAYAAQNVVKRAWQLRNAQVPEDFVFLMLPFSEEELLHAVRTALVAG